MRRHKAVDELIERTERQHRCMYGADDHLRRALRRRHLRGELVSPYRNVYARAEYWKGLTACQRSLCVARALHARHPDWVFAGETALDAHDFDHPWAVHDRTVTIADPEGGSGRPARGEEGYALRRAYMPPVDAVTLAGIPVAPAEWVLVDCATRVPFLRSLPMFDAAIRKGTDMEQVRGLCRSLRRDCSAVDRVLRYANGKCENGGESLVYGVIVENGFPVPQFQEEFRSSGRTYRVDFLWRLSDGRTVVLEYDGMRKYVDPAMAGRKTVGQVVGDQLARDRALAEFGVTTVLHCTYDDVFMQGPLVRMLLDAGVPRFDG
ncbi:hypothetical protein [Bifidobacterium platyrrhinorum]|uniref:CTP synthase n=1 Tax=Bifidobacterium platyrrhinorum TaxID=2661628 RepID=A0A6L9SS98_9BIFI|nr:hypothetical protein [Bifidobacterium platyrrhinorum]NEG54929.1 hypothetical protein [Bifidobacterium platyrrhinorum]